MTGEKKVEMCEKCVFGDARTNAGPKTHSNQKAAPIIFFRASFLQIVTNEDPPPAMVTFSRPETGALERKGRFLFAFY